MKASVNATITFGLVTVPVGVASAIISTNDPSFKVLHNACSTPINRTRVGAGSSGSQVDWCPTCDVEVDSFDTIRGYEFAKGEYALFTNDELTKLKGEESEGEKPKPKTIELHKFVKAGSIASRMIDCCYFLIPNKQLSDPYGLLFQALAEKKLVGIGSHALWQGKEHPCAVVASREFEGGVLMLWGLHLFEDLAKPDFSAPIPNKTAMEMPRKFVEAYTEEFDPQVDLVSRQRARLQDAIAAKIEGRDLKFPEVAVPQRVTDIQAATREMYERKVKELAKPRGRRK